MYIVFIVLYTWTKFHIKEIPIAETIPPPIKVVIKVGMVISVNCLPCPVFTFFLLVSFFYIIILIPITCPHVARIFIFFYQSIACKKNYAICEIFFYISGFIR